MDPNLLFVASTLLITTPSSTKSSGPAHLQRFPPTLATITKAAVNPGSVNSQTSSSSRRNFLHLALSATLTSLLPFAAKAKQAPTSTSASAYDLSPLKNGQPYPLSSLNGKVTLFVNVASYCALTPQYTALVTLHNTYQPQGFEIIASPCNQFARQEPGNDAEICQNVKNTFGARFLLLDKLVVNESPSDGPVDPLYRYLRSTSPERIGQPISWNFEKFLVGADGKVLRRYSPGIYPEEIEKDIKFALTHPIDPLPPKPKPYLGVA